MTAPAQAEDRNLTRAMGLLQATATNVISMVGVGPFLTIPFMVAAMNGPHVIYAWIAGLVLALADGLVYAQLGAALPGSGGGYLYLREAFQPFGLGKLMAFLFIFQTILVAPLSVAGGAVGFADYLQFVWTSMTPLTHHLVAALVCVAMTALLWRNIEDIGRLAVVMLVVVLLTVGWVIVAGLFTFSPAQAFDFPPAAFTLDRSLLLSVGAASVLAMYSYGGYNQVCNIGDEIGSDADDSTVDRAVDVPGGGALHADDHRHPRHDPVARGAGLTDRGVGVHLAHVLRSSHGANRRHRDDGAHPLRGGRFALRDYPRLLAHPVRRGARWRLLQGLRARAPDQALPRSVAGHDRGRVDPVLLFHAGPARQLVDSGAGAVAVHLAVRGGRPAPALSARHSAAVHDVVLSLARTSLRRALAVHLLHGAVGGDRFLGIVSSSRDWGVFGLSICAEECNWLID